MLVDFSSIWGSHLGSKTEPERVHKGLLAQVGSPGGPRGSPGVDFERIFDDFGSYFGVFLVTFSEGFRVHSLIVSHGFLMFLVLMSVWLLHRFQRYFLSCSAWSRQRRRRGRRPHDVLVSRMGPLT